MYFTKQQIETNINKQYGINNQLQLSLTNGNVEYIIELAREMKISYTIPSLALHISQIFFQKKCYLFYDRFLILTAAFALASKLKDLDCRLINVCKCYYNIVSRMLMTFQPFNEQKMKKIKDEICIAETQILRTLQYRIDFDTPHDYLKKYVQSLSQPKDVIRKVFNSSRIIILDSYRSKCCLLYSPLVISICALLIGCRYEGFRPYISEQIKEQIKNQQLKQQELILQQRKKSKVSSNVELQVGEQEQGQIMRSNEQSPLAKSEPSQQQMYKYWLRTISSKEGQDLKQNDIFQCLKIINSILLSSMNNMWN